MFATSNNCVDNGLVEEVIPKLVTLEDNNFMKAMPREDEIKTTIFGVRADSALGPDGFGAFSFQNYWDIISGGVVRVVLQFFASGWMIPNFNSNLVVVGPKIHEDDSIDKFRPIALANFKFKII